MPSMYQGLQKRKIGVQRPLLAVSVFIVVLLAVRILNLGLWWHTNRLELQNKAILSNTQYTFLGFSSRARATEELEKVGSFGTSATIAVAYYDLFTPIGFVVLNRQENSEMVDMGRLILHTCPGPSSTQLYFHGAIIQNCSGKISEKYYEQFLLQRLLKIVSSKITKPNVEGKALSFIQKPLAGSNYLRLPYLIYFYVPLVFLILLTLNFGPGMLTGFFYFVEVFFLFDYRQVLAEVPFSWVKSLTGGEFGLSASMVTAVVVAVLALFLFTAGLFNWRSLRERPIARLWVLFFLLLPFIIRL